MGMKSEIKLQKQQKPRFNFHFTNTSTQKEFPLSRSPTNLLANLLLSELLIPKMTSHQVGSFSKEFTLLNQLLSQKLI